ncbi:MAG TPA: c-type cytochrome [Thermoleophilaceae bacterium]|nr:c-type cytochrome [Thermoleophilaceae bacterium]
MTRPATLACALIAAVLAAGCGGDIKVSEEQASLRQGAQLFVERCSGCHSLDQANSHGSKAPGNKQGEERTNGPNFNVRKISREDALYAIRNGGFSGAIMPANIVVGRDARLVAQFLAEYAGSNPAGEEDVTGSGQTGG